MSDGAPGERQIFAIPDYRRYLSGRFLSSIAQHIQTIGVGLYVYEMTRDPLALGLAGFFTFLPQLMMVAVAGHVADSSDRRLIVAGSYLVQALAGASLLALVISGTQTVAFIYCAISLIGIARAFGMPAGQAMLANLVAPHQRPTAIAWQASLMQSATIAGPAIGGFLYLAGPMTVFASAAVINLVAAAAAFRISPQTVSERREQFSWRAFTDGASFIWTNKVLMGALSLDLVSVLFAGTVALLPIFATDILAVGAAGLGWLRTAQACGALVMALFLARFPIRRHGGAWMLIASAVFGLSIIGFGLSKVFWLSLIFMAFEGAADMVSIVVRSTLIQNETPDAMRGRVSSVNTLFIGASNSLGEFESGLAASFLGVIPATILGGCLSLLTTAAWAWMFPALRRRDRL